MFSAINPGVGCIDLCQGWFSSELTSMRSLFLEIFNSKQVLHFFLSQTDPEKVFFFFFKQRKSSAFYYFCKILPDSCQRRQTWKLYNKVLVYMRHTLLETLSGWKMKWREQIPVVLIILLGVAPVAANIFGVVLGVKLPVPTVFTAKLPGGGFFTGTTTLL